MISFIIYLYSALWLVGVFYFVHSTDTPEHISVKPSTYRGIVVDAGSGGSRLHVYQWEPRIFNISPPALSHPKSNERWTSRIGPGVANFVDNLPALSNHLKPLLDFAKDTLIDEKDKYAEIPIYFYATGGVRLLNTQKRDAVIDAVRDLLRNDSFCPFFFHPHFARVISGEEEAIFSWAATNFLMGTLLPASTGSGIVMNATTHGTVDLGGASTQIAYYLPSQDILEGLYKFQIGNHKIWNVYTKSFLSFGVVSARQRHIAGFVDKFLATQPAGSLKSLAAGSASTAVSSFSGDGGSSSNGDSGSRSHHKGLKAVNYCFYAGYSETAFDSKQKIQIEVSGPELPRSDQLQLCLEEVRPLMEKQNNEFCNKVYHGDCSIAGSYQPPLPVAEFGQFIGTSSLAIPWKFLQLPATASLELIRERASSICQMNFDDIMFYYEVNFGGDASSSTVDSLPYFCFLATYVIALLEDGYSFHSNQTLTVMEQVNGNRMGWALGAILYEINQYPYELRNSQDPDPAAIATAIEGYSWLGLVLAAVTGFCLGALAAYFVYREATQTSYTRVPYEADIETDTHIYDGARRPGSGDALRRREPRVYSTNANSSSTASAVEDGSSGGRSSNGHTQNIIPTFTNSNSNGVCKAQAQEGSAAPLLPISTSSRYGTAQ